MTNKTSDQPVTRQATKQERERDAATAMHEYEAEKAAVLAKTARLRAMRLAKAAGDECAAPQTQKVQKPRKTKSSKR